MLTNGGCLVTRLDVTFHWIDFLDVHCYDFFNIKAQYTRVSLGELFNPSNVSLLALHWGYILDKQNWQISPNYKDNNCEILNLEEKK